MPFHLDMSWVVTTDSLPLPQISSAERDVACEHLRVPSYYLGSSISSNGGVVDNIFCTEPQGVLSGHIKRFPCIARGSSHERYADVAGDHR